MSIYQVGEVRPSQILWTYGPGSLIDLPNISVLTMGLEYWNTDNCTLVDEVRLLAAVQRILGPQVKRLYVPPFVESDSVDPRSAEGKIGVPVKPFPRWLRCVKCGLLAEYDSGLFEIKENLFRPERTHFIHKNCEKGGNSDAVPARFLLACRNGHLDDFPWNYFVHGGPSECKGTLRFYENKASLQTEDLWVRCDSCHAAKSLAFAFGTDAQDNLPACRGRHPHLNKYEDCTEETRTILLGATNGWFPVTISVLAIPQESNLLEQLVHDGWEYFFDCETEEELKTILKTLGKRNSLPGIENFDVHDIWRLIEERKRFKKPSSVSEGDIKGPEWSVLISDKTTSVWPQFKAVIGEIPESFITYFSKVVLLERLREVNALIGYTRIEAQEETNDPDERPPLAALSSRKSEWIPAVEVHGEGIFIQFNEVAISEWENRPSVKTRNDMLLRGHAAWRTARQLDPKEGYPGIRYTLLHTFSHLLIRELSLECGYNAASIRERIYASTDPSVPMAGVLIYTAAADSDGTLGGLVELGKKDNLGRIIEQALQRSEICSSDPLCSEHDPEKDRSLHSAACHACVFVSETSCERGNRYLDRALLVQTFTTPDAAFFSPKDS
jgi:hypothetical protein